MRISDWSSDVCSSDLTSGFAPTTEFDRAENWPPAPPPYTRAEYQLDRTQAEQAMPQPADGPARRRDDDAHGARPAAMDRAASDAGQAPNLDPTHPAHPRHAPYQGCAAGGGRTEERRGGEGCGRTCRVGGGP